MLRVCGERNNARVVAKVVANGMMREMESSKSKMTYM